MHVHLIDGSGYIYRAFYGLPPLTRPSDGMAVHAIYGYCKMLTAIIDEHAPQHMAVIMDGGRSGRTDIDPEYKANRKPRPPELIAQIDIMAKASIVHGVPSIKIDGMEADDVIASYARIISDQGGEVTIHTSDKDLMQLLTLPNVRMYDHLKKQDVTHETCVARLGVAPDQVLDYLALVGDASDNIPGVPGIGAKTAASLLQIHMTLDAIVELAQSQPAMLACKPAQAAKIAANIDLAIKSRDLAALRTVDDLPTVDGLAFFGLPYDQLIPFCETYEFAEMASRYREAA
jgi:DNA polymerase-1